MCDPLEKAPVLKISLGKQSTVVMFPPPQPLPSTSTQTSDSSSSSTSTSSDKPDRVKLIIPSQFTGKYLLCYVSEIQRWKCPIYNGTFEPFIGSKTWKKKSFLWLEKCLFLIIYSLLLISKECSSHFCRETVNENKQFKETRTWISNSYLIRQRVPL